MLDLLTGPLKELIASVLRPIWNRILGLSWPIRASALVILGLLVGLIRYPAIAEDAYSLTGAYVRVALSSGRPLPLSRGTTRGLDEVRDQLSKTVAADLLKISTIAATPWSAAQGTLAMNGKGVDPAVFGTYVRSNVSAQCPCWAEEPRGPDGAPVTFISGWIMAAMAKTGVAITQEELEFVLSQQDQNEGWWSTFVGSSKFEYASTYTTAWMIIGLREQQKFGFISPERRQAVDNAVIHAANWLAQHRNRPGRWKPYPNLASTTESESISGVVVHALHAANALSTAQLDGEWLESLPNRRILASDTESYYIELRGENRVFFDHFVQIKLPWMVIATVDAFPAGTLWQKAKALHLLEQWLEDETVSTAYSSESNWWRAELLHAVATTVERAQETASETR